MAGTFLLELEIKRHRCLPIHVQRTLVNTFVIFSDERELA